MKIQANELKSGQKITFLDKGVKLTLIVRYVSLTPRKDQVRVEFQSGKTVYYPLNLMIEVEGDT